MPCLGGLGGVSGPGGQCVRSGRLSGPGGGVPGPGGVCLSALWDTTTPPVDRMTNRCKNITLATTSLRPVKRGYLSRGVICILLWLGSHRYI